MASHDPDFERKAADIIGLYLNPPRHAAVFCVDEKTAIQTLDRRDRVLPLSPGRAERHGFEYKRNGHAVAVCGPEYQDRQGAGQNGSAPYQPEVCALSRRGVCAVRRRPGNSHHLRQPLGPQDEQGRRISPNSLQRETALHAGLLVVAQSSRTGGFRSCSGTSSHAASSLPRRTWPASYAVISTPIPRLPSPSTGNTPTRNAASAMSILPPGHSTSPKQVYPCRLL